MALDPQLKQQLQQTVLIASSTSVNDSAERVYTAAASHKARVVNRTELRRYDQREELVQHKVIILGSSVSVDVNSKVWLPGETTSADRGWSPTAVGAPVDENGTVYYKRVFLGNIN